MTENNNRVEPPWMLNIEKIVIEEVDFEKLYQSLINNVKASPTAYEDIKNLRGLNPREALLGCYLTEAFHEIGITVDPFDSALDKTQRVIEDLYPNLVDDMINKAKDMSK